MQVQNQLQPIQALVPIKDIQYHNTLVRKLWHVLATAEFMIPQLTFSLRVTKMLMMFDMKIYLSVEIVVIPMVGPSQLKLDYQQNPQAIEGYIPIEAFQHQQMAIGCATWELPVCARCFLGYSCKTHKHN